MIVWSGRGFLSIIVLFVTLFFCISIFPKENADYGFIITAFVTGIFSWYFGTKWNTNNERIVIDEKTGQRLIIKNNHSLFWIPMQYWGIVFSALGIIVLIQNSILLGIICSLILLALIIMFLIKKKSKEKPKETVFRKSNIDIHKKIIETEQKVSEEEKKELEFEKERIRKEKEDPSRFMPK